MKVRLERTGGVAGIRRTRSLDSGELPQTDCDELCRLVREARFFDLPARLDAKPSGTDRFQYRITVETAEGTHTVGFAESSEGQALVRPLLDWILGRPEC